MELPVLSTERLELDRLGADDAPRIADLAGDRDVARNTESIPHPYPEDEAEALIEKVDEQVSAGRAAVFGVRRGDDRELIGMVGLHLEREHERGWIGYWIGKPYWNRGYATEAAERVVRWGFEARDLRRIYAESFARNAASGRVLEKIGMEREGVLRDHFKKWGEFVDVEVYGLLAGEGGGGADRGASAVD